MRHQLSADGGRAGERQLAYGGIGAQLAANGLRVAAHDIEYACRQARGLGQRGQGQRRQRRRFGGFYHHRTASGQRRRYLAGNHGQREIPRCDGGTDADCLLDRQQPRVGLRAGNGLTVGALAFFGKPFDERGAVGHLSPRLGQRLATFGSDQAGEIFGVVVDGAEPGVQHLRPGLGRACPPFGQRCFGGGNGTAGFRCPTARHLGQQGAVGRVVHGQQGAVVGSNPLAVHIVTGTQ